MTRYVIKERTTTIYSRIRKIEAPSRIAALELAQANTSDPGLYIHHAISRTFRILRQERAHT